MNTLFKFRFDSDNEYITEDRKITCWMELAHKHTYQFKMQRRFVASNY
jgi:cellulose synthase/poly-beta-1,6-N-acetylglucosamine synthase-like glycosyltransferase